MKDFWTRVENFKNVRSKESLEQAQKELKARMSSLSEQKRMKEYHRDSTRLDIIVEALYAKKD